MAVYAIYHVNIFKSQQKALDFPKSDTTCTMYQDVFESLLQGTIPVNKMERDNLTRTPLSCTVERKHDRVSLLLICNEKSHKYLEKKDKEELIYHPGCYVIIDNRIRVGADGSSGSIVMAIERTPAFDNKPDKVRDILQDSFNALLSEQEITVDIRAQMHEGGFWEAVNEQCFIHKDYIRRVTFDFPNPKFIKTIDAPIELSQRLLILSAFTCAVNAAKGSLNLESDKKNIIQLDRTQEDIAQMVTLCCRNGYNIEVRFAKYGLYRFGNNIKAFADIKEEYLSEFSNGITIYGKLDESTFELINWLNNIRQTSEYYTDEETTSKKRTIGSKKRNRAA